MTSQEKLKKIEDVLQSYAGNEDVFTPPSRETTRQKQFREDLHTVVSLVFTEDLQNMSVGEIKARLQKIWERTKPKE